MWYKIQRYKKCKSKSNDLLSASWRARKAGGRIHSDTAGLRTGKTAGVSPGVQRCENQELQCPRMRRWTSQLKKREQEFAVLLPFCSISTLNRLGETHPHWWGASSLLNLPTQTPISFGRHPHRHMNKVLLGIWGFLSQVKLTDKINHRSILYKWKVLILLPSYIVWVCVSSLHCHTCSSLTPPNAPALPQVSLILILNAPVTLKF